MKTHQFLIFIFFIAITIASCKAQKSSLIKQVDAIGNKDTLDNELGKLRSENDLLVIHATESLAWARSVNYTILARNNGDWKGYIYHASLMKQSDSYLNTVAINKAVCDSVFNFLNQHEAWKIKGDSGQVFCNNGSTDCVINDAGTSRLWIITKKSFINPSYYAPGFYEKCCPQKERGLFLTVTNQIERAVNKEAQTR